MNSRLDICASLPNRCRHVANVGLVGSIIFSIQPGFAISESWPTTGNQPHPAVVRVIVPEDGATSYGSGTLVDVRDRFGLIITNWHVVRDATGTVEVLFSDGFRSKARSLKVDADWDLAALVIWKPRVAPVTIASMAPQPGDRLTICGYGQGMYRALTGRCTKYYAPRLDFPRHMVELDVEARQGDSGGPIFNHRGEMAGVLFGAGEGTTLGSFGGRVGTFLATLAPGIGEQPSRSERTTHHMIAEQPIDKHASEMPDGAGDPPVSLVHQEASNTEVAPDAPHGKTSSDHESPNDYANSGWSQTVANHDQQQMASVSQETKPKGTGQTPSAQPVEVSQWSYFTGTNRFEQMKSFLAAIGLIAIVAGILRAAK